MSAIRVIDLPLNVKPVAEPQAVTRAPRIGVLYPSGWGNLGDEAVLQVTFAALRKRWPDVSVRAFTLHPGRTSANHGVEAEPLTGVNRYLFGAPLGEGPLAVRAARGMARGVQNIPLVGGLAERASNWVATLVFEAISLNAAWRWLRTADLLIASGGGQIDDVWGGTWGQPYALARWAWLAKRAGVPFAFFSVGYGGASGWLSRRLLRYAVDNATYCSIRDIGSRALTIGLGVDRDLPIVPDLSFVLTRPSPLPARRPGYDIGVSPMVYQRPGNWPVENRAAYQRFVALWANLATSMVAKGNRVHFFISNPTDMTAVQEVWEKLDETTRARCKITAPETPNALLEVYRGLDLVVASRFHGVLLAILSARPVLALSHDRKVRSAMSEAGISEYCADLDTASEEQAAGMLQDLTDQLAPLARRLSDYAEAAGSAVRQQDDLIPMLLKRR